MLEKTRKENSSTILTNATMSKSGTFNTHLNQRPKSFS